MIELSKIRLVNWYGFSSMTVPIGAFTLIAGKNGNGKSVLLDAIKYALYGDTVFNKSTENKGSRTIPSYTRGLLDATANSYMRPADKMPNVYTHIVLEMHEKELDKYFILGTVIETNSGNGIITQRYVIEEKHLNEIEHTYEKGTDVFVYSAGELQKKYGLKMFSATEGLAKFMQRTGLRLNEGQLAAFRRKLRSIMSYDPNAKIDQFIRESVLEEKKVDFTKLVETKSNIDKLTETIMTIDSEISELENILRLFEEVERKQNVILTDDINKVIKAAFAVKAATLGVPVKDTIKFTYPSGIIKSTPDRSNIWSVQTPQVFEKELYLNALKHASNLGREFTDDCQLIENTGNPVMMCEGDYTNIKITQYELLI